MKLCYACGAEWRGDTQPGTRESCACCGTDLHACRNCRHFDEHRPYQCRETDIDHVRDKERYNFCECFQCGDTVAGQRSSTRTSSDRSSFDALFKK